MGLLKLCSLSTKVVPDIVRKYKHIGSNYTELIQNKMSPPMKYSIAVLFVRDSIFDVEYIYGFV